MTAAKITKTTLYLTFGLEEEIFAIDVAKVREVLDLSAITKVPHAPDFLRGVINVRGNVVPVMDMRAKFGLPQTESTVNTRIIIMELTMDGSRLLTGVGSK